MIIKTDNNINIDNNSYNYTDRDKIVYCQFINNNYNRNYNDNSPDSNNNTSNHIIKHNNIIQITSEKYYLFQISQHYVFYW